MDHERAVEHLLPDAFPSDPSELLKLASTDELTQLANRPAQEIHYNQLVNNGCHVGILLLDLDSFKQVNEEWGFHLGDVKLRQTADYLNTQSAQQDPLDYLNESMRESDRAFFCGRLGGDEFILIFNLSDRRNSAISNRECDDYEMLLDFLERIRDRLVENFKNYPPIAQYNQWAEQHGKPKLGFHSGLAVRQPGERIEDTKTVANIVKATSQRIDCVEIQSAQEETYIPQLEIVKNHGTIRKMVIRGLETALRKVDR